MTQYPGPWGPQGGDPQNSPQGGYPQQQPNQGQPPQGNQGYGPPPQGNQGYGPPPQGDQGYGQSNQGGYPPQSGPAYPMYGGGYGPQGPPPGGAQRPPAGKPRGIIIGIVVAALVVLVALGGILTVLTRSGGDIPAVSISPSAPVPPTEDPTTSPTKEPTDQPPDGPTDQPTDGPTDQPTDGPTDQPSDKPTKKSKPSGDEIDLGRGIGITPADGWKLKDQQKAAARLSDGKRIFVGQVVKTDPDANASQLCTAWHKEATKKGAGEGSLQDPKPAQLSGKVKAATCFASMTISDSQGSTKIYLYSLASIRQSDGVSVLGTIYFLTNDDTEEVAKDFSSMATSMVRGQVAG